MTNKGETIQVSITGGLGPVGIELKPGISIVTYDYAYAPQRTKCDSGVGECLEIKFRIALASTLEVSSSLSVKNPIVPLGGKAKWKMLTADGYYAYDVWRIQVCCCDDCTSTECSAPTFKVIEKKSYTFDAFRKEFREWDPVEVKKFYEEGDSLFFQRTIKGRQW